MAVKEFASLLASSPELAELQVENERLRAELADKQAAFDIRWNANMRAIKRWQEATGRTMTWPDHADLCVWLMEQLEAKESQSK